MTKLAAFTLSEFKPLFDRYSVFKVIYDSDSDYHYGGVSEIYVEDESDDDLVYSKDLDCQDTLTKQAKLFDLIFQYNFFTGLQWQFEDLYDYRACSPLPYTVEVKFHPPSQHERLEAALELQSWLEGKLPDKEIRSYFDEQV